MCSSVARDIPERGVFTSVELCVAVLLETSQREGVFISVELCVAVLLGTSQRGECLPLLNCV